MNRIFGICLVVLFLASCSDDPVYWVCDEVDPAIKTMMSEDFKTCLLKSSISDCRNQLAQMYCKASSILIVAERLVAGRSIHRTRKATKMIIRNGFVSNSSSSNFIIGFDREPNAEYLKATVFNNQETVVYTYGTERIKTDDLVDELVYQLSGQKPMTLDQIAHQMEHGYYDERLNELTSWWPEYPSRDVSQAESDRIEKENIHKRLANAIETRRLSRKLASKFLAENPNKIFFLFDFSDDNRIGSHLEHGEVFSGLPFLRISYH